MPIIRSAKKKLRQDKKRAKTNLLVKRQVKTAIKSYKTSPDHKLLQKVYSVLDVAAKKNVYHHNKVSRLKSRLSKLLTQKKSKLSKPSAASPKKTSGRKKSV